MLPKLPPYYTLLSKLYLFQTFGADHNLWHKSHNQTYANYQVIMHWPEAETWHAKYLTNLVIMLSNLVAL